MARRLARVGGRTVHLPTGRTWASAFASRNQRIIDAWYRENTGHRALGLTAADLLDVPGLLDITDAWLTANLGGGHVTQVGGRWLVQGVKCHALRFRANNVTVRGALIDRQDPQLYGASYYLTTASVHYGAILEYATMKGNGSEQPGHYMATGNPQGPDTSVVRNCRISGFRSGGPVHTGTTVEYCYVHDLHLFGDAHNTSATVRGSDTKVRRNNFKGGTSSALSIYADDPLSNVLCEENILNTPDANYCLNFPSSKTYAATTTNTRLINNLFGQDFNVGCGSSGPQTGIGLFTTRSGNTLMDGTAIS